MNLALFDLDGTLIPKDSDHAFGEFVITLGWADAASFRRRNDAFYEDYLAGSLDIDAYVDFASSPWRGRSEAELQRVMARFLDIIIKPMLHPRALALVQRHQQAGDRVAVVTATNDFVTRPIAQLFGVHALIATDLERDAQGRGTGRIAGVPAFREGKITRVQAWLAASGQALKTLNAPPSTATPPTTCRCWNASANPWPPTPAPSLSVWRCSAAGPF